MLLTIYNLPQNTRYQDIRSLIKAKCGLSELILDNLTAHTQNSKKVTVGLPEEEDAAILVRKINGLYLEGYNLVVEPIKKKVTNTNDNMYNNQVMSPFSSSSCNMGNNMQTNKQVVSRMSNNQLGLIQQPALQQPSLQQPSLQQRSLQQSSLQQPSLQQPSLQQPSLQQPSLQQPSLQQPYYQQASFNTNHPLGFAPNNIQQNQSAPFSYGARGSNNQNVFANYGYPQQMASQSTSQLMSQPFNNFKQEAPLGFGQQSTSNVWLTKNNQNSSDNASAGNNSVRVFSPQRNSRWDVPDKNSSRSSRDAPSRDRDRDRERNTSTNSFGRDARGQERMRRMRRPPLDPRDYVHKRNNQGGERDFRRDSRDHARNDRNNLNRASPIKPAQFLNTPAKPSPWQTEIFGKHVTEPSFHLNAPKFSKVPKIPRPSRPRDRANPKQAIKKVLKEKTVPPAKRPRKEASTNLGVIENKKSPELIPNRAVTWRAQLASSCAREILNNPKNKTDLDPELVLIELKAVIRNRLASLVGTNYEMRMNDMSTLYKSVYNAKSDRELFNKVTEDIKKYKAIHVPVDADEAAAATEQPDMNEPAAEDVQEGLEEPPTVEESEPVLAEGDVNAEKYKSLFKDEQVILSQLQQDLSKAIDEELDEMCEQIIEEFNDEPEAKYKNIHEQIKTSTLTSLKPVIKVNMAKRILNVQPVVMRIFVTPKIISKGRLGPVLEAEGVTTLTKTSKSYIGTCSSYEELDRLCTMKPLVVDGSTVVIKPYQLAGQKQKVNKDAIIRQRQSIAESFTKFALQQQKLFENKQENAAESTEQADEVKEQCEVNDNDENIEGDELTEEGNYEESSEELITNSAEVTENDSENKLNYNQNAEGSQNIEDNTLDATGEQETPAEKENNLVEDNYEQVEDSNDQVNDNNSQIDENNSQENKSPNENQQTDTNEPKTNENNVNIKTEENKQETDVPEKVNTLKQEPLNKSFEMAEDSDGSINGIGDLDQAMKSEDIDNLDRDDYDDIDMADLNEDDLEDW